MYQEAKGTVELDIVGAVVQQGGHVMSGDTFLVEPLNKWLAQD